MTKNETFKLSERNRQTSIKHLLFSKEACINGTYTPENNNGFPVSFYLNDSRTKENIYEEFRENAIKYFADRSIPWHRSSRTPLPTNMPDNHLLCSQSFCVNVLFYFYDNPLKLNDLLNNLGYNSKEVLPFEFDKPYNVNSPHYICFEWIGLKNYLKEIHNGIVIKDDERTRGEGFTSADFAIRYLDNSNNINLILCEWKYTELYEEKNAKSEKGKKYRYDRVYKKILTYDDCPVKLYNNLEHLDIFDEPFYQLMRLQLLANEIEENEIEADKAHVLLISPEENTNYSNSIISKKLKVFNKTVQEIWSDFVPPNKFKYINTENLFKSLNSIIPKNDWTKYLNLRYKWW